MNIYYYTWKDFACTVHLIPTRHPTQVVFFFPDIRGRVIFSSMQKESTVFLLCKQGLLLSAVVGRLFLKDKDH